MSFFVCADNFLRLYSDQETRYHYRTLESFPTLIEYLNVIRELSPEIDFGSEEVLALGDQRWALKG